MVETRTPYAQQKEFERERAEAGVLLTSDEITKSKHGIAVKRE